MQPCPFFEGYVKGVLKFMSLTKKEKDFCKYYLFCKNPREAAAKAGYVFPELSGIKLLERSDIGDELLVLSEKLERRTDVADGLRRIAFGSVADAVKLALQGGEIPDADKLDLFSVSEIKIPKSGGIEIKFYDRIKALEALASMDDGGGDSSAPFIDAILKGSAVVGQTVRSEEDEI